MLIERVHGPSKIGKGHTEGPIQITITASEIQRGSSSEQPFILILNQIFNCIPHITHKNSLVILFK
ncbi:hypothetical protein J1N35_015020, partial [Gossypium stocksii]